MSDVIQEMSQALRRKWRQTPDSLQETHTEGKPFPVKNTTESTHSTAPQKPQSLNLALIKCFFKTNNWLYFSSLHKWIEYSDDIRCVYDSENSKKCVWICMGQKFWRIKCEEM